MISVTLSVGAHGKYKHPVGKFVNRKHAFREAKRAAGLPNAYLITDQGHGYEGPNGMAWILEEATSNGSKTA